MARLVSILLLSLYVVASLRPFLPYVSYQLNQEYYAKVLCRNQDRPELNCDGKCYLAQQLKEAAAAAQPEAPQAPDQVQVEDFLGAHVLASWQLDLSEASRSLYWLEDDQPRSLWLLPPTPPPRLPHALG